jgi:thiamine-phosphate pyrophosphorylase
MIPLPRLYAIADASFGDCVRLAEGLFAGGARLVQLRNKKAGAGELLAQVERVRVIVNDRVDVALLAGAAGVHLGQTDIPPAEARRILGPDRIIGFSTHNFEQAIDADKLPVDYIAVGPIFATSTKENPDPVVGLSLLAEICRSVHKPVVAIGGIKLEQANDVLKAGATSIAVIRDLMDTGNLAMRVREWVGAL